MNDVVCVGSDSMTIDINTNITKYILDNFRNAIDIYAHSGVRVELIKLTECTIGNYLMRSGSVDFVIVHNDITLYVYNTRFDPPEKINVSAGTILLGWKSYLITDDDNTTITPFLCKNPLIIEFIANAQITKHTYLKILSLC